MSVPVDPWSVGWYRELGGIGQGVNVVMAGHVDWWDVGAVVFYNLHLLGEGDVIKVFGSDGETYSYQVTASWTVAADSAGDEVRDVIGPTDSGALTLITCTGDFDGTHYLSRLIVRAVPI